MNYDYDVAVIGLGPVGSFAALLLEKRGLKVLAIDKDKEIVLFCAGGLRSALAAKSLKDMGFEKVSHIDGGFGLIKQSKFKISQE